MYTGKIKIWNGDRGFGFITRDDGGPDAFLHVRYCQNFVPAAGLNVAFDLVDDDRGTRARADNVRAV